MNLKIPKKGRIMSRSSTLTNIFIASLMPYRKPTDKDFNKALKILRMSRENILCVYCGKTATEWDHLHPFVLDKKPTGYYTTIFNLVPSCGKCNQSKGNKNWENWMRKKHAARKDLEARIKKIKSYEKRGKLKPLDVIKILGNKEWEKYITILDDILEKMAYADEKAIELANRISAYLKNKSRVK